MALTIQPEIFIVILWRSSDKKSKKNKERFIIVNSAIYQQNYHQVADWLDSYIDHPYPPETIQKHKRSKWKISRINIVNTGERMFNCNGKSIHHGSILIKRGACSDYTNSYK